MSARTTRTRAQLLAAAALTVATLSLTACNSSEGVRDEGASKSSSSTSSTSEEGKGTSTGKGHADTAAAKNDEGGTGISSSTGAKGPRGSSGAGGASGSAGDPSAALTPCTDIRTTATVVDRPLNHLLLTVTNTGSKNCDLVRYPAVRLGAAQSVPPAYEDSKPQAVVTLAPGESGYAGVLLSAADGSGSNGYTARTLTFYLDTDSQTPARPSLPKKGVYVDDSIRVTYWQASMADALSW
ncbi:hypothetical protein QFZ75_004369 [Streptomyces sp. V3I8]|uniref:DUF4232 domain-containing protein n=1 Tax=Streptomyces sp. V3I8 TaxID=3042279 RepID=UPI0027868D47|nr:DUF4232 domain-containing protein [Streptomyces sp. V3I8]MDQ1037953.1 hypothetical protein [Streptomyces sp. V3I8]